MALSVPPKTISPLATETLLPTVTSFTDAAKFKAPPVICKPSTTSMFFILAAIETFAPLTSIPPKDIGPPFESEPEILTLPPTPFKSPPNKILFETTSIVPEMFVTLPENSTTPVEPTDEPIDTVPELEISTKEICGARKVKLPILDTNAPAVNEPDAVNDVFDASDDTYNEVCTLSRLCPNKTISVAFTFIKAPASAR